MRTPGRPIPRPEGAAASQEVSFTPHHGPSVLARGPSPSASPSLPATGAALARRRAAFHLRAALPSWLAARAVVGATFAVAHLLALTHGPLSEPAMRHLHQGLLGWDAERYVEIATFGYAELPRVELRFFPLLPLAARLLGALLGSAELALVVLSNAAALVFGALVHALCLHERGDERLAARATWFVAFTPAAFVLAWGYSEALWGCVAVGAVLALRRQWWWWAALLGVAGGLSRPVGLLLVLPALVEAVRAPRPARGPELVARGAAVVAPVAGTALYLGWVGWRFGDPMLPYRIQQQPEFRGDLADPATSLLRAAGEALAGGFGIGSVRLVWAVVLIALVVATCRSWPASYGVLAVATLVVALGTHRLGSFERYGFAAFPVVLHLATVARTRAREAALLAVGAAAMATYGTLALFGVYVP